MSETSTPTPANPEALSAYPTLHVTLLEKNKAGETVATSDADLTLLGTGLSAGSSDDEISVEQGILTDNPQLLIDISQKGPAALDDPRYDGGSSVTAIEESGGSTLNFFDNYETIASRTGQLVINPDHTYTINYGRQNQTHIAPGVAGVSAALVPATLHDGKNGYNQLAKITKEDPGGPNFFMFNGYRNVPSVRQVYDSLGFAVTMEKSDPTSVTLPTPQEFSRRMAELRQTNPNIPEVVPIEAGAIVGQGYVGILATGKFPCAVADFYFYQHDIATDHLAALLEYGEPLMDLMTRYAVSVEAVDSLHFSKARDDMPAADLQGDDKFDRAALELDQITATIAYVKPDRVAEEQERTTLSGIMDNFAYALRASGQMQDSLLAKSIMERDGVQTATDITGSDLLDELTLQWRERHGVLLQPKHVQEPGPVVDDDVNY